MVQKYGCFVKNQSFCRIRCQKSLFSQAKTEIMNIVLIVVAILLVLVGLVGSVAPGIAGPPFSFLGILLLSFVDGIEYSTGFLVLMGMAAVVVFVLDYIVPAWGTKKLGGSKAGVRGSTIGLILGLLVTFMFPVGFIAVLVGPFVGAYIGEKQAGTDDSRALKAAFGSFMGFLVGTGLKVIYACVCIFYVIKDMILWITK